MYTKIWNALYNFSQPIGPEQIKFKKVDLQLPKGFEEKVYFNWQQQLLKKQEELARMGILAEIRPFHLDKTCNPLPALYEAGKAKMWPGPIITLYDIHSDDNQIELHVSPFSFPYIDALNDREVINLFKEQKVRRPRPAFAICTLAQTLDEQIVLTLRGPRTNVYPNRLFGQGGRPQTPAVDIIAHQQEEMLEEIFVRPDEYNPAEFLFGGVIQDVEIFPGEAVLCGWNKVNLTAEEIKKRVDQVALDDRETDAVDVVFIPKKADELFDFLSVKEWYKKFTPTGHGALVLYGQFLFGRQWAEELMKALKQS